MKTFLDKAWSVDIKDKTSILISQVAFNMAINILGLGETDPINSESIHVKDADTVENKLILLFSSFGIVGNLISFVVLNRKPFREEKLYAYLSSLSFVDFWYMIFTLVRHALTMSK